MQYKVITKKSIKINYLASLSFMLISTLQALLSLFLYLHSLVSLFSSIQKQPLAEVPQNRCS